MFIVFKDSITRERIGSTQDITLESLQHIKNVNVKGVKGEIVGDFTLYVDNLGITNHIEVLVKVEK